MRKLKKAWKLTEEDPRPPSIITNLDFAQPTRQQPPKRSAERRRTVEQSTSQQHLMSPVEEREINDDTTQNPTFKQS